MSLRDWTKKSGAFRIGEFTKSQGELVTNGDCEVDIPNIGGTSIVAQRGTIAVSTDQSYSGSQSAKFVGDGSTTSTHYVSINNKLTAGKEYHFGTWVYIPAGNTEIDVVSLRIWNGSNWNILQTTTIQGSWVYLSGTTTVEITNWVAIYSGYSSATNETFYIDDVSVTEIDPLPTITTGTKYLECTSNGIIKINHNTTTDADASIDYYDGSRWVTFSGKLSDLITTHAWLSKEGNYLLFTLTTGQAIANIKIYDGVRQ